MRPASHRVQVPDQRCANCKHCLTVSWKHDDLCFYGDSIVSNPVSDGGLNDEHDVLLDGDDVSLMDGDEYSKVWGGRVVDLTDVCDNWTPKP